MNTMTMIFDKAANGLSPLEKMKLIRSLNMVRTDIAAVGAGALAAMKKLKLLSNLNHIRVQLGSTKNLEPNKPLAPVDTAQAATNLISSEQETKSVETKETPQAVKTETQGQPSPVADISAPDPVKKSASKRQKDNNAAIDALRKVKSGEADAKDPAIREALKGYSGSGGGLKTAQGTSGSPHEYYTPAPVAKAMWNMLDGLGFSGGKVLDPSSGMGVFARTKPDNVAIEQIELDSISGEINGLLNDGPTVSTRVASFEEVAASTDDETFDAVVTNVPFGDKAMRGAHWRKDKKYQNANLQEYFILRGLEKIKPSGFAAFIVPPSVVAGKGGKGVALRNNVSMAAEFVGAYRLPNVVFDEAGADTITDIIILRKHSKDNKAKIDELAQQNAALLTQTNVIWPDFVEGNYFKLDGKRFQIGESTVGKGRFGEVEKVAFTGSIGSIAALLKPFPKASRIDWAMLGAVETVPIVYAEGDTVFSGGAMLQMTEGKLVPVEGGLTNDDAEAVNLMARFTSPLDAINQGLTFDDASRALTNEETCGRLGSVSRWIVSAQRAAHAAAKNQGEWFDAIMAGMAVQEFAQSGNKEALNYAADYPELSKVLARVQGYASKRAGVGGEVVAEALQNIAVARKKGVFTPWWTGNVAKDATLVLTVNQSYAKIKLESEDETGYVPAAEMRQAFADFDPLNDDAWCVSPDGSGVMSADDYYFGNYAEFLARAQQELSEATDPAIKEKLLRQHAKASERITLVNPSRMKFSLETAFVSDAEKAEFIKQYVSENIQVGMDANGKPKFSYEGKAPDKYTSADEVRRIKTLRRFAIYLNNKTITTGSGDRALDDPKEEQALLDSIKAMVNASTAQFDAWCKSNEDIASGISRRINAPENLRFVEVPDYAPVDIPNWNPAWVPHGYQYAAVRRYAKRFSGILALDVGLGKAQPLDSKILTPDGWRQMGDMRVGDMVISVDGIAVPVTGVFPQGEKEIFEVEFSDGSKTKCCDEHLWETQTETDRKNERYAKRNGNDRVINGTVKSLHEIRETLIYQTQKNHKIPMVSPVQFPEQALQIHPYLMGVLLGDGSLSHGSVSFTKNDAEIPSRICHLLKDGFGDAVELRKMAVGERCDSWRISRTAIGGLNPVRSMLDDFGLMGTKSDTKFIPKQYLIGSVSQRIELLHGLMDTDGYVSKDGMTVQFSSTSKMLSDGVVELVQSLGGIAWTTFKTPTFTYKNEKKEGKLAYTVSMRMPSDINPFLLERKASCVKAKSKYIPVRYFTAVREVGKAQAQCISIDHPTHLYVTDDYIVTHNTLTALAAVQYAQSIGSKKKTVFVVPNSVLTNWKKEAGKAYQDTSDCLFVGLQVDDKGKAKYSSKAATDDLNTIRENRHSKIFMTYETLTRIPLREDTLQAYKDYLLANDDSFSKQAEEGANEKTRDKISAEQAVANAIESGSKAGNVPFFEDMGIDSIIVEEAHSFKNSKKASSEFKATRFVANPESSKRGMDMQAKCWYIRGMSGSGDGVLGLTATPVTNSPSEIYSMMALTIGEKEMNAMCGCTGTDSFMMNTCDIENREEDDLTGAPKSQRTLKGIANLDILRRVLDSAAMIETPETVAAKGIIIEVPEAEEAMSSVEMSPVDAAILKDIKDAYLEASSLKKARVKLSPKEAIMASPFNAIRNMTKLITDKELYQGKFLFGFDAKEQAKAEAVVAAFNKLKITEECKEYELPFGIDTTGMKAKMVTDKESGNEAMIFYVPVLASIEDGKIVLPAVDYQTHDRFMTLVNKSGLGLTANASPKTQALLANLQKENASPRWKPAKQIVFCDELALHHKLKLLITAETGIPSGKICIVNAKSVSPDEIQNVQDGFNANEDDNQYQIIIANKKAEVGINLQNGTQAIHHLTIGWTPDSIHQRNGRGVRQGNKVETPIMIYHYEANGTFDAYKRRLVSVKGDWIKSLMDKDAENVAIEGDLSAEDYARMTSLVGDSDAMAQFNSDMAKKAKAQVAQSAKITQVNSLSVAMGQQKWLDKFENDSAGFTAWVKAKVVASSLIADEIEKLYQRAQKTESTDVANRCNAKISELNTKRLAIDALYAGIDNADNKWLNVTASKFPDTAAVANWTKDVAINRKMLDEANAACLTRVTHGYSKETLDKVASKEAVLMGGKILAAGDFVIADGKPGVLKMIQQRGSSGLSLVYQDDQGGLEISQVAGMSITMHGTQGSEDRAEILKMLVNLDEDQIKASNTGNLFAYQSMDVRRALRSVIPSRQISFDGRFGRDEDCWVAAPHFPVVMPPDAEGPFCARIVAEQSNLIEFSSSGWQKTFRFKDSRNQGEGNGREAWQAVAGWMTANSQTMTMQEVVGLDSTNMFQTDLRNAFSGALDAMVATCTNLAELDAAMVAWASATYPWVGGFDASMVEAFNLERFVNKAKAELDDGSVKYDVVVDGYRFNTSPLPASTRAIHAAIVAAFAAGALNAEMDKLNEKVGGRYGASLYAVTTYGNSPELVASYKQVILDAIGGQEDGDLINMAESPFAELMRADYKMGKGAVVKLNWDCLNSPSRYIDGLQDAINAYAIKQKQAGMGLDVDGLLAQISNVAGVASAKVGMVNHAKVRDKYTGSHLYKAGEYIRLLLPRGGDLNARFANKVTGLQGRAFDDRAKEFLVSLVPAKFSDGKDVADVIALARYLSIDPTPYKKG
ncbi:MAG: hypothetical protein COW02_03500 [Comamonadaceae bacterium CG12_big_fil_rev_8_21_14_0_65_59_15]|nr:MAG: hypothetical protein COW02_03500 [Comamonadaceae bacterium CG12_big_fil_rev_8_21_14_0_65_59_15]